MDWSMGPDWVLGQIGLSVLGDSGSDGLHSVCYSSPDFPSPVTEAPGTLLRALLIAIAMHRMNRKPANLPLLVLSADTKAFKCGRMVIGEPSRRRILKIMNPGFPATHPLSSGSLVSCLPDNFHVLGCLSHAFDVFKSVKSMTFPGISCALLTLLLKPWPLHGS